MSEELDRIRVKAEDTEKRALAFIDMVQKRIRGTKRKYVKELEKLRMYDEWRTETWFYKVDHKIRNIPEVEKELPKMPNFEAEEEDEKEKDKTKTVTGSVKTTKTPAPQQRELTDAELDAIDLESDIDTVY